MLAYAALTILQSSHSGVSQANAFECNLVAVLRKGWYQLFPKYTTLDWWRQRVSTAWLTPEFLQTPSRHMQDIFSTDNGLRDNRKLAALKYNYSPVFLAMTKSTNKINERD
jgi:hypothetical protein